MRCPQCQEENPDKAKFCLNCGARLAAVCPQCGTELPAGAKFCLECGAPLPSPPLPAAAPPLPSPIAEGERGQGVRGEVGQRPEGGVEAPPGLLRRLMPSEYAERLLATRGQVSAEQRLVTILWAGVRDVAALTEKRDPAEVAEILNGALDVLIGPICRHEGTVARLAGHAVLAFFGAPIAHEDDPVRACRAALEIAAGTRGYAARLEERGVAGGNVGVGIHTGLVVIGEVGSDLRVEYTAVGDAVDVAEGLGQVVPVGEILISHDIHRHVRGLFEAQDLGPLALAGRAEPVPVYRLERARPRAFRQETRGVEGIATRMVGREAELRVLQDALGEAIEGGETQMVTVVGEAGVGKSRLLYEFENWLGGLPDDIACFKGRASAEMRNSPYGIVRDMFASRFDIRETDSTATALEKFRAGMAGILAAERADPLGHLVGFDFSASPAVQNLLGRSSFAPLALADLLHYIRTVASRPTVLFLEDLHWADDSSLDLVSQLGREIPRAHLLIVGLARPQLFERRPLWGEGEMAWQRIELGPLSKRDSRALVAEILQKVEHVPADLRDVVVDSAEGNPYYVEELIRMLVEDGVIVRGAESWHVESGRLVGVRVPPTLAGVLQARLDSLPPEEKSVLQRAAVVGREFWDVLVTRLADEPAPGGIGQPLRMLRERELVFQREQSAFSGADEYVFKHALLRDVVYETVLARLRQVYHKRVAQWLETNCGERLNEYSRLIADHYEKAGEKDQAGTWLRRAGEAAYQACAFREALAARERALALMPEEDRPGRALLLLDIGSAQDKLGQYAAARASLQAGLALARELGDAGLAARALRGLSWVAGVQGDLGQAQSLAEESLVQARASGDRLALANSLMQMGGFQPDRASEVRYLAESLAIFQEVGSPVKVAVCLLNMGNAALNDENPALAERHYRESLALFEESADRWGIANCLANLGLVAYEQGDYPAALRYNERSLPICREIGDREGAVICLNNLGYAQVGLGDAAQAVSYFHQALSEALATGLLPLVLDALTGLSKLRMQQGEYLRAAEMLGLVQNHPALNHEVARTVENALAALRTALPAADLAAGLARGKSLELEQVVAEELAGSVTAAA